LGRGWWMRKGIMVDEKGIMVDKKGDYGELERG